MDVLEKFLHSISYRFPKGYPDINDEQDKKLLESILEETIKIPLKEVIYNPLSFHDLSKHGGYRFKVLADKIKNQTPFELIKGESTPLQLITPDHLKIWDSGDSEEIRKLSPTRSINSHPFFKDDANKEYTIKDLLKTPEFGGMGKGSGTVVEDYHLSLLKNQIKDLIEKNGGEPINVIVDGKKYYDIIDAVTQPSTPKSDFNLINSQKQPIVFISHKKSGGKGPSPNDFMRWGGYTKYSTHPEVEEFTTALKKWILKNTPDNAIPPSTRFISKVKDKDLIQKIIYGEDFGKSQHSKDNVTTISQGKITLTPKGNNNYELTSEYSINPPTIPQGGYSVYLTSAYRGDRKMFGIKNNEAIAKTEASALSSLNVYELKNGNFLVVDKTLNEFEDLSVENNYLDDNNEVDSKEITTK